MIVRHPKPATKATVCVVKIIDLPGGVDDSRYGTGFWYRDATGHYWLITNWHVLTGRRPDEPGMLIGDCPQSPRAIAFGMLETATGIYRTVERPLYENGVPSWRQHQLGPMFDIAAIRIDIPAGFDVTAIQDAASGQMGAIEPGFDLIVVGFPFQAGQEVPYALWKRAMLASEPSVQMFSNSQMLIDTAGTPGMSGSPVFVSHAAYLDTPEDIAARQRVEAGESSWFDETDYLGLGREAQTVGLEWIGIYAGATGSASLSRLQLGRMYAASAVDDVIRHGVQGYNPFPPTGYG